MVVFGESVQQCKNCPSTQYYRRKGFHLWNHFYCPRCQSNFHSPKKVNLRTSSSKYDGYSMHERTYENLNKARRMKWRWRLLIVLIVLVAITVAVVVVGTEVLFGIPFAMLLWAMIKYPPRRKYTRKRKGWF